MTKMQMNTHALTVRIPEDMFRELKTRAARSGRSVSDLTRQLLGDYITSVGDQKVAEGPTKESD